MSDNNNQFKKNEKVPMDSQMERTIRFWDYLKKNTDEKHIVTKEMIKKDYENMGYDESYFGHRNTFREFLSSFTYIMHDEDEPAETWRVNINVEGEHIPKGRGNVKNIHYIQPFTYDEMDKVIEAIHFSKNLDTKTANNLIQKLKDNMTSKHYNSAMGNVCKIQELDLLDRGILNQNISTINKAIKDNFKIAFYFNGYDNRGKLVPVSENKYEATPFYVVAYAGRYYMLASMNHSMTIWRIDLMTDVEIPRDESKKYHRGYRGDELRKVKNMPQEWKDDFLCEHIHMSYDDPVDVVLRIRGRRISKYTEERQDVNYTFLHDWFGNSFTVDHRNSTPKMSIVKLRCSPFGITHWAMQYSDLVEILEPEDLRNQVKELLEDAMKRYGVMEGE